MGREGEVEIPIPGRVLENLLHPASLTPLQVRGATLDVDLDLIHTQQDQDYLS